MKRGLELAPEYAGTVTVAPIGINCYIKTRRKLEKLALDNGYRIEYCFLMCTPEKAMKNIEGRDRKVPKEAIDRMYNALMNYR